MELQYMLSNGTWVGCGERTEEFLARCEKFNGVDAGGKVVPAFRAVRPLTRDEAIEALGAGKELRNDSSDWYSQCRAKPAPRPAPAPAEMVRCSCGHSVPKGLVMSASLGTSCPDCYDRMSA